jgi:pimeloyl-ACP methyl ester carboxylesterase
MRSFLRVFTIIYILAFAALWFGRFAAIYPFDSTHVTPRDAGVPAIQEYQLSSFDGTSLIIWSKQPQLDKPTIIYFHGNAGNLANRAQRFDRMIKRGYGIVAMAYRGSSGSKGSPSQQLITQDSQFLITHLHNVGLKHNSPLIYYGESLGTGAAVQLAVTHPPTALILEAPFTSITDIVAKQFPIFPIRLVLDQKWDTLSAIRQVTVPLLIVHGAADKLIPPAHSDSIFHASPSKIKALNIMPNTSHLNIWSVEGQKTIYNFIKSLNY